MNRRFHKARLSIAGALASAGLLLAGAAQSYSFSAGEQAFNVTVTRIFSGQGTTYVEFTSLPGCWGNGGYLTVSWAAVNGGQVDENRTKQIVATLLFAKGTDTAMEVRYRRNLTPSGWDSCTIDAVFLN